MMKSRSRAGGDIFREFLCQCKQCVSTRKQTPKQRVQAYLRKQKKAKAA
jgi:hypothetical protein